MEESVENRLNRNIKNIVFSIFPNNFNYILIYLIITILIIIFSIGINKIFINNKINNLINKYKLTNE